MLACVLVRVQTGIAWYGGNQMDKLRGACRDDDGLQRWGWTRHDGVSYGSQFIGDRDNGVVRGAHARAHAARAIA